MIDLTPNYTSQTADQEVVLPVPVTASQTAQPIGGFMASPSSLINGSVTLNGAGEQILVGAATDEGAGAGVFIGKASDGGYDFRAGNPTGNFIHYDDSAGTLVVVGSITVTAGGTIGGFNVGSDYIRDAANTFGLASTVTGGTDVRFWAGASFSSRGSAPARILEDGSAYFQNVVVGGSTLQYTMNDTGVYTFGDGSDGTITLDGTTDYNNFSVHAGGNYTLSRDIFAESLTVQNNVFLFTNGYRIFCRNTLTLQGGGQILNDGNDASGATPGAAQSGGYLSGGAAGGTGGSAGAIGAQVNGSPGSVGSNPTAILHSLSTQGGTAAASAGNGGAAGARSGGGGATGATGGTKTSRLIKPCLQWNFMSFFDVNLDGTLAKYVSGIAGAGGGGGGGGTQEGTVSPSHNAAGTGGPGGGGGGAGGIIYIAARNLIIMSSSNIFARGGKGGNGGNGGNAVNNGNPDQAGGGGGGGGGSGGAGGIVFLIYNTLTNAGTITVDGGAGGSGGTGGTGFSGGSAGGNGTNASAGATGEIIQINMAL